MPVDTGMGARSREAILADPAGGAPGLVADGYGCPADWIGCGGALS